MGRLKSIYVKSGKVKIHSTPYSNSKGYCACALGRLHRLVAEAFIPNPQGLPEIDHIDGNPSNNAASNLRWCTHRQNIRNPITISRMRKKSLTIKKNVIQQFTLDGELVKEWKSGREVSRAFGVSSNRFSDIIRRKNPTWRGFVWKRVVKDFPRYKF